MSRVRKQLEDRFGHFVGQPWFELAVDAFETAWERDDEWLERRIIDNLIEQTMLAGVADKGGECWDCHKRTIELRYDGQCNACAEKDDAYRQAEEQRKAAREAWLASLSPAERERYLAEQARVMRLCMHGLISRDVQ